MFVDTTMGTRINAGQCPVRRAVFLKPHGVAKADFIMMPDLPEELKVGIFAHEQFEAWIRFSSDTVPGNADMKTTVGVGIKLFAVPGKKMLEGDEDATTSDFLMQNMNVFFVDTAKDMCEFTQAGVVNHDYDSYLKKHPETKKILDAMAKKARLNMGEAQFKFLVQFSNDPVRMPVDKATVEWDETASTPIQVYALDENDKVLHELTADEADIEWRVHVANRKAGWYQFNNALDLGDKSIPSTKRNGSVTGTDRDQLIIDPGPRTISGKNKSGTKYRFDGGKFYGKEVPLGEIRTDKKGRLMVFGGDGVSASRTGVQAVTFANNDGWHDDVSDGT
eukprot:gene34453-biopygen15762